MNSVSPQAQDGRDLMSSLMTKGAYFQTAALAMGMAIDPSFIQAGLKAANTYSIHGIDFTVCAVNDQLVSINLDQEFLRIQQSQTNEETATKLKVSDCDAELEIIFNGLAKKWKDETRWSSITMRRYAHSSYQSMLVLGGKEPKEVTKLILKQMQKSPDMWFEALRRLNNSTDDPAKNAKSFEEATNAWLDWGRMSGLIS